MKCEDQTGGVIHFHDHFMECTHVLWASGMARTDVTHCGNLRLERLERPGELRPEEPRFHDGLDLRLWLWITRVAPVDAGRLTSSRSSRPSLLWTLGLAGP